MPELNVSINPSGAISGSKKVVSAFDRISKRGQSLITGTFNPLNVSIGGLTAGFAAKELTNIADEYTSLDKQLEYVTGSTEDVAEAQETLFAMSQKTGTAVTNNTAALVRLSAAQEIMGTNTEQNVGIIGGLNSLMGKTGVGASEAAASMTQLTQALGSGVLAGDEFKSLNENFPALMQRFADSMGVSRGELKQLASEGKITTEVMTEALLQLADEGSEGFDELPNTVEKGWTRIRNSFENVWATISSETGIMGWIADGLTEVGEYIIQNKDIIVDWAESAWPAAQESIINAWGNIVSFFDSNWSGIVSGFQSVISIVQTLIGWINKAYEGYMILINAFKAQNELGQGIIDARGQTEFTQQALLDSGYVPGSATWEDIVGNGVGTQTPETGETAASGAGIEIKNYFNTKINSNEAANISTIQARNAARQ